jgi:hypothetical protein
VQEVLTLTDDGEFITVQAAAGRLAVSPMDDLPADLEARDQVGADRQMPADCPKVVR